MSISGGWQASKHLLALACLMVSVLACSETRSQVQSDVPISVSIPGTDGVDIEMVLSNAQALIDDELSGAYPIFFSFVGDCADLKRLRGEVNLYFVKREETLLGSDRTYLARVQVDTVKKLVDFEITDETSHYPTLTPLVFSGMSIAEIAANLQTYLEATHRCADVVVLQRTAVGDDWAVRCGPPEQAHSECLLVDPATGEIRKVDN